MATIEDQLREQIRKKNAQLDKLLLQIDELKSQTCGNHATRISNLEREVKSLKADKARLKMQLADTTKQLDLLQKSHNELLTSHETLSREVDNLKQKDYILVMAQVAQMFQEDCYKYVFVPKQIPEEIRSPNRSYNLKKITKEIKKATKLTDEEREVANTKWEQLKTELHWDYKDMKTIIGIKDMRNGTSGVAHPKLTQDLVDEAAAELLLNQLRLNTEFTPGSLQKLKEMWSTMNEKNLKRTWTSPRQGPRKKIKL